MSWKKKSFRIAEHFSSKQTKQLLVNAGFADFATLWQMDLPWVEKPNIRRHGWSGVSRVVFPTAGSGDLPVYIKRQQNHCYRCANHAFLSRPTAYREYRCLTTMKKMAAAVPELLYYGERRDGRHRQAVLVTREISNAIAFDEYIRTSLQRPLAEVRQVLHDTARLIDRIHCRHIQHSALYGKHVLIANAANPHCHNEALGTPLVPHLIDLEKCRRRISRSEIAVHDLSQFYRHTPWPEDMWALFLKEYRQAGRINRPRWSLTDAAGKKIRQAKVHRARIKRIPNTAQPLPRILYEKTADAEPFGVWP